VKNRIEMSKALRVCVIIPTKNRRNDLLTTVRTLLRQTILPTQIVIVDQSPDDSALRCLQAEWTDTRCVRLDYVHDPSLNGAATARNRAMELATGGVWLFLDDDVILEPDFIEQILAVYRDHPNVGGVSGVITNYPRPSALLRVWNAVFVCGPFRDERQPIYWNADRLRNSPPLAVRRFGGGLMSFRADVIRGRWFDENLRGVSDGEDVDFCMQLGSAMKLVMAPRARLEHWHSPVGRLRDHWLRRSVRGNFFLYKKNWNKGFFNRLCYGWLLVGYCFVATVASVRRWSLEPWRAMRTGADEAGRAAPRPQGARAP